MSLNIEDPETLHLAAELAQRTGEPLAVAVTVAVRERLERISPTGGRAPVRSFASNWQGLRKAIERPALSGRARRVTVQRARIAPISIGAPLLFKGDHFSTDVIPASDA